MVYKTNSPLCFTMAPIRRYLRITKYSVLECRIYLDNPALVDSWFLNARNPILPRVIESVRPLILPKLQEEKERSKAKGKKTSKGIKDVVVEGLFSHPPLGTSQLISSTGRQTTSRLPSSSPNQVQGIHYLPGRDTFRNLEGG